MSFAPRSPRSARACLAVAICCVLLACAEAPSVAPPAPVATAPLLAAAPNVTPIHGRVTGRARPTRLAVPGTFRLDISASGPVSQAGIAHAQWVLPEVSLDMTSGLLVVVVPTWSVTLDVANGDQLVGRYTFRTTDIPVSVTGDFTVLADVDITGGTGRFLGASGRCASVISGNVLTKALTVDFSGALTRDVPGR